jgi:carbon storage regulator
MLILSRKVGQTIVIGDGICVTVGAIRGNCVRLGVSAYEHVSVDRQEVYGRRAAEQEAELFKETEGAADGPAEL